jgi:hypothetical protein
MHPAESREELKHSVAAEVLRNTGKFRLAAFGSSMLPTLWPGEVLTIQAQSFDSVQPSEVVLFSREGRFFIHRVVAKLKGYPETKLITRGDALPSVDALVSRIEFLGKVVSVRRGEREIPVPACSRTRRWMGLALTYSVRLRSLAFRWHAWWADARRSNRELATRTATLR